MEDKHQSTDTNEENKKIKYSKVDTNDDTILETNEVKPQNSFLDSIRININENGDENDSIKHNTNQKIGILNRNLSHYFYMKLGNTYTFFGDKEGSPLIVIGPHYIKYVGLCSFVSLIFIFFLCKYWTNLNLFFKFSGIIIYLTFFISYTYTFLVNPGIPKSDGNASRPKEKHKYCGICGIWINLEDNIEHCFDCNICYEGYDHHCPWTGKCIAKRNLNSFYLFLVSILFIFCYLLTAFTHAQHNIFLTHKKKF